MSQDNELLRLRKICLSNWRTVDHSLLKQKEKIFQFCFSTEYLRVYGKTANTLNLTDIHAESALYWKAFGTENLFICVKKVCWFLDLLKRNIFGLVSTQSCLICRNLTKRSNVHHWSWSLGWNFSWFNLMTKTLLKGIFQWSNFHPQI